MRWPTQPMAVVAPPLAADVQFADEQEIWHLTLDQIESHTGRISKKQVGPAGKAGNSTFTFDQGNVLYSKLRPYLNKVIRPDEPGIATTELIPLRPDPRVLDPMFLTHYLRSPQFVSFASACVAGAKMPRIIMPKFWEYQVPLPPLSEQRRIVETLDQAVEVRVLDGEANARAERILPTLFLKMFGPSRNWSAHPRAALLGNLVKITSGATPSKTNADLWDGTMPWVSPKDMKRDFVEDSEDHVSRSAVNEANLKIVPVGSVLIVVRGMILAHSVPVALSVSELTINQDMKALIPRDDGVSGAYVWAALKVAKSQLLGRVRTAGHGTRKLDTPEVLDLPIVVPTSDERRAVDEAVLWLEHSSRRRAQRSGLLQRLLSTLSHRAFSGELTASWSEAHSEQLLQEMERQARVLRASVPQGTHA